MGWIHLIILLSLLQLTAIIIIVGKARVKYGVKAPAISGSVEFERYYRVQMNTIELIVLFIPSIVMASLYWSPYLMAILGLIYLIGRILFFYAYIGGHNRTIPFLMSFLPIVIFIFSALFGTVKALIYA